MAEAARLFVERWIRENVRPERDEDHFFQLESCADAIACVHSAMAQGIRREDILGAYKDLVSFIAGERRRMSNALNMTTV